MVSVPRAIVEHPQIVGHKDNFAKTINAPAARAIQNAREVGSAIAPSVVQVVERMATVRTTRCVTQKPTSALAATATKIVRVDRSVKTKVVELVPPTRSAPPDRSVCQVVVLWATANKPRTAKTVKCV